jgi:uncharacterized protein
LNKNENHDQIRIKIKTISNEELEKMKVMDWSTWDKEESEFDWYYPNQETCYVLEGKAEIKTQTETVTITKGDFVIFPKELNCRWKIIKTLKKHYKFG